MSHVTTAATAALSEESSTQTIEIGQRRFAFACYGRRSPTVVLETGLGAESSEWAAVQRGVSAFARVFRYDRAGRGASDRVPAPRDAHAIVDDLRRLLDAAGVPGPYVLVGQSLGGMLMRIYARRHRAEVVGLVLVDSMHEDQFDVFGAAFPPATPFDPPAFTEIRRFWTGGWRNPDATAERIDLVEAIRQGRDVVSLDDLALHVVTAGSYLHMPFVADPYRAKLQSLWEGLQAQFLRLSSRSTQTLVRASGHFVQRDDPETVIDAIREVHRRAQVDLAAV